MPELKKKKEAKPVELPKTVLDAIEKSKNIPAKEKPGLKEAVKYSYQKYINEGKNAAQAEKAVLNEIKNHEARKATKKAPRQLQMKVSKTEVEEAKKEYANKSSEEILEMLSLEKKNGKGSWQGYEFLGATNGSKDPKKIVGVQMLYNKFVEEGQIKGKTIKVDGIYSGETRNAVEAMQQFAAETLGLKKDGEIAENIKWKSGVDGIFGIETLISLKQCAKFEANEEEKVPEEEKEKAGMNAEKLAEVARKFFKDNNEKLRVGVKEEDLVSAIKSAEVDLADEEAAKKWLAENFFEKEEEKKEKEATSKPEELTQPLENNIPELAGKTVSEQLKVLEDMGFMQNVDKYIVKEGGFFGMFKNVNEDKTLEKIAKERPPMTLKFTDPQDASKTIKVDGNLTVIEVNGKKMLAFMPASV